jgi:hypothetical protein
MRIGLCFISEEANTKAMKLAASNAWDDFPEPKDEDLRIEALNDYLITNVLARACVHESDSSKLFFATAPEALIRVALTAGGIRRLWLAYERMVLLDGPLSPELDLEELPMLQEKLATMATLDGQRATRAKRLAQALLNELSSG